MNEKGKLKAVNDSQHGENEGCRDVENVRSQLKGHNITTALLCKSEDEGGVCEEFSGVRHFRSMLWREVHLGMASAREMAPSTPIPLSKANTKSQQQNCSWSATTSGLMDRQINTRQHLDALAPYY